MRCNTCQAESSRIVADKTGRERCHACRGFSEAGGTSTSGSLTRNALRIRSQRDHHEGDFVQPHTYNKARRKVDINPDFVKMYPDEAAKYYSEQDMARAEYKKLPDHAKKLETSIAKEKAEVQAEITYEGDAAKGIERVLN